jgi:hypothetical protein
MYMHIRRSPSPSFFFSKWWLKTHPLH